MDRFLVMFSTQPSYLERIFAPTYFTFFSPRVLSSPSFQVMGVAKTSNIMLLVASFFLANPEFSMMLLSMFAICKNFQVLYSIVCSNSIFMVDYFSFLKFSFKKFFNNYSVFIIKFSIDIKNSISLRANPTFSYSHNRFSLIRPISSIALTGGYYNR